MVYLIELQTLIPFCLPVYCLCLLHKGWQINNLDTGHINTWFLSLLIRWCSRVQPMRRKQFGKKSYLSLNSLFRTMIKRLVKQFKTLLRLKKWLKNFICLQQDLYDIPKFFPVINHIKATTVVIFEIMNYNVSGFGFAGFAEVSSWLFCSSPEPK